VIGLGAHAPNEAPAVPISPSPGQRGCGRELVSTTWKSRPLSWPS
jgi:hypothetical protein